MFAKQVLTKQALYHFELDFLSYALLFWRWGLGLEPGSSSASQVARIIGINHGCPATFSLTSTVMGIQLLKNTLYIGIP
jgi:hypothetical protein